MDRILGFREKKKRKSTFFSPGCLMFFYRPYILEFRVNYILRRFSWFFLINVNNYVALSILNWKENNKSSIVPVVKMFVSVSRGLMFEPC